ncbi:MAG: DNA primase [Ruminococcaceae bacterium]|nr:DNA primase [Oscillospiraceae bacterium]
MIPRDFIEELKQRCDLEEVVGSYVQLRRAGANLSGCCPFHSEKTPSFTVFPDRHFYCFGCGAGGDVISFIMRQENLDYAGAIAFLAARAGLAVPQQGEVREDGVRRSRVLEMNKTAARYFREILNTDAGAEARAYLAKRQLSGATVRRFGLGFAPNDFSSLYRFLRGKGYTDEEMIAGFLCRRSDRSGHMFSLFRNRIMFPIIDVAGNVIAFGGRVMDDSKPKYLNSSDTPAFKKSKNLFALNYAKGNCAEQMILCEGYMDVIALHAAGFPCAVATLGTAITPEQARLMTKYTSRVVISYDSDEAGQRAAQKALRILGEVGLETRVLRMTGAKDPDEYIKAYGPDRFRQLLAGSSTGFEYRLEAILAPKDLSLADEKIKAAAEVCRLIAASGSRVEREVYILEAAKRLELPPDILRQDVEREAGRMRREQKKQESREAHAGAAGYGDRVNPDAAKNMRVWRGEETVLGLMLLYDEHRAAICSGAVPLTEEDFFTDFGRRAFGAILELERSDAGFEIGLLGEHFTPEELGRLEKMRIERRGLSENSISVLRESAELLHSEAERRRHADEGALSAVERKRAALAAKKKDKTT